MKVVFYCFSIFHVASQRPFINLSYFGAFQSNLQKLMYSPHVCNREAEIEESRIQSQHGYILRPDVRQTKAILLPIHILMSISLTTVYFSLLWGLHLPTERSPQV